MLNVAHQSWQHPGDKPGRHQFIELEHPTLVGIISNTPWPLRNQHVPTCMANAARDTATGKPFSEPAALCSAVLEGLRESLVPFLNPENPTDDDWEASWDFGGDAAVVALADGNVSVARVGNLRVLMLTDTGDLLPLLTEHTYAVQHPELPPEQRVDLANVITACLANPELPSDAVLQACPQEARWLILGTPSLLDYFHSETAFRTLNSRPFPEAASALFEDACRRVLETNPEPHSAAILIVELPNKPPSG